MLGVFYWLFRVQRVFCAHDLHEVGEAIDARMGHSVILSCSRCGHLVREPVAADTATFVTP